MRSMRLAESGTGRIWDHHPGSLALKVPNPFVYYRSARTFAEKMTGGAESAVTSRRLVNGGELCI